MNEVVQKFISDRQNKIDVEKLQLRNKHLISLGLVDKTKSEYHKRYKEGDEFDKAKKRYYKAIPIDVTEEEYELICKYCHENNTEDNNEAIIESINNKVYAINNKVYAIKKWIELFGILTIIGVVVSIIVALSSL